MIQFNLASQQISEFDSIGYECCGLYRYLQLYLYDRRNPGLLAAAAAVLPTLSGCSHPQGMEHSPVLFRSERETGGGVGKKTDSETDIYRESGRK